MADFKNMRELMEYLAKHHKDILHSDSKKHFVSYEDEGATSVDSLLCYPAMVFLEAKNEITGQPDAYRMETTYSISIVKHCTDTGKYKEISQIFEETKRILIEILNVLLSFKRKIKLLSGFSLSGTEIYQIINVSLSHYGYVAEIKVESPYRAINCDNVLIENP